MKLELSNKMLTIALIGLVVVIVLALIIKRYRSRSKFEWPVPNPAADDNLLSSDLQGYQDTYNLAMIGVNAMSEGTAKTTAMMTAETTLSTAINNRVGRYVTDKCPEVSSGTVPTDATKVPFWNTYQSDLAKVQQAYYTVVGAATPTSAPPSEQVLAARKADISGATRKYIATVCPNFYKTTTADPSTGYTTWAYVATGTASANGLLGSDVTPANVTTWAGYAAKTKSTTSSLTVSPGAGTGPIDLAPLAVADTTGFVVGDSVQFTYQVVNKDTGATTTSAPVMGTIKSFSAAPIGIVLTVTSVPATGYIVPSGTVIAKAMVPASTTWSRLDAAGVPNWKKARDYGPGSYPKPVWGTV